MKLGQSAFFEIPSGVGRKGSKMLTYGDMDGEMITKERVVSGGPGTGWGEGWRYGCDV